MSTRTVEDVKRSFGSGTLISDWTPVTQSLMDQFSVATLDPDWMHTDPVRARSEGFDGTIAFGFWTVSMLTHFLRETTGREYPDDARFGYNYGLDRVRFLAPIPVGSVIRNRLQVTDVRKKGPGRFVVSTHNEIEVRDGPDPAMVADWLMMLVYPEATSF